MAGPVAGHFFRGSKMKWLNEPPSWQEEDGGLSVVTGDKTDFWRTTHYGFIRDDGHLRYRDVKGDMESSMTKRV